MALKIYLIALAVMSLVTFALYGADKSKAKRGVRRIPERTLLCFSFFFLGALGGLLGMEVFRHKTKHWYFWAVNLAGLITHIAILAVLAG